MNILIAFAIGSIVIVIVGFLLGSLIKLRQIRKTMHLTEERMRERKKETLENLDADSDFRPRRLG